jgi:hypothetical protein
MVFNATFNNISVISWSVLLVEKTTDLSQVKVTDKLYYTMLYWVNLAWAGFKLTMLVAIGINCIGSYKPNYHAIMTLTAPPVFGCTYSTSHLSLMKVIPEKRCSLIS